MSIDDGYVLVIGSAGIDVKGRPDYALTAGVSHQGYVRNTVGGVARNIAENLSRLEVPVVLLSVLGEDDEGHRVLSRCRDAGISCDAVRIVPDARTGTYMSLLKSNGDLDLAISDYYIMQYLDADYLAGHEDLFAQASMVVIDATPPVDALDIIFEMAERYELRVCADPTTPSLAGKLCPYLDRLYLIVPNASETESLCGLENAATNRESALNAARQLVGLGVDLAVVTLGEKGLAYADSSGSGYIRALKTSVVDTTGAGDAFSGAVIFGLLNDVSVDEAMRLGATAASLTLQSRETVLAELNQEMLYEHLI